MPSSGFGFTPTPHVLIKVSATGNDFILAPQPGAWANRPRAEWAKLWCDRHHGVGADGAVFLETHSQYDFAWDFYNSDGSPAEMCGNAARAVSLYMSQTLKKSQLQFLTRTGVVKARVVSADHIEVALAPILKAEYNQWSENENNKLSFDFIVAGVPHAVLRVPNIEDREGLRALSLEIKRDARFQAAGTNVTFVKPLQQQQIESVTFERGVEDFTLSCGTGAVAAAHSILRGEEGKEIQVQVPGGQLFVLWKQGRPCLRGPARVIAEIHWLMGV